MKLRINYVDAWGVAGELQITGIQTEPTRRMVEVELTPEQKLALSPAVVGYSGNKTIHERVESIYLQEEKANDRRNDTDSDTEEG